MADVHIILAYLFDSVLSEIVSSLISPSSSLSFIALLRIVRRFPSKIFEARWAFNLLGKWASINVFMPAHVKYIAVWPEALDEVTTGGFVALKDVLLHPLIARAALAFLSVFGLPFRHLLLYIIKLFHRI